MLKGIAVSLVIYGGTCAAGLAQTVDHPPETAVPPAAMLLQSENADLETAGVAIAPPASLPEPAATPTPLDPPTLSQSNLPFSDVPPTHWAYEALLFLSTGRR